MDNEISEKLSEDTSNQQAVSLIIHGFTAAHFGTAFLFGPFAGFALAPMTLGMVLLIGKQCRADFSVSGATAVLSNFVGYLFGTIGGQVLAGLIPGIGNAANAFTSAVVTETLGWSAYVILQSRLDESGTLSKEQMEQVKERVNALRQEDKSRQDKMNEIVKMMSDEDRKLHDDYVKAITKKDSSSEERAEAVRKIEELLKKYDSTL